MMNSRELFRVSLSYSWIYTQPPYTWIWNSKKALSLTLQQLEFTPLSHFCFLRLCFEALSTPTMGLKPRTLRSGVTRSTDWANQAPLSYFFYGIFDNILKMEFLSSCFGVFWSGRKQIPRADPGLKKLCICLIFPLFILCLTQCLGP